LEEFVVDWSVHDPSARQFRVDSWMETANDDFKMLVARRDDEYVMIESRDRATEAEVQQ